MARVKAWVAIGDGLQRTHCDAVFQYGQSADWGDPVSGFVEGASFARSPAALRTSSSWRPSEGRSQTVAPPRYDSALQSGPHSEPVHTAPRPSSPALCRSNAKGYLLLDFFSGAPGTPGRFSEGLLLRRLHPGVDAVNAGDGTSPVLRVLDELPTAGTVVDDEGLHSTRFHND